MFLLQILVVREVRLSPLEMIRKSMPELDKLLKDKENDPEALEKLKNDYPELQRILSEKSLDTLLFPTTTEPIFQDWLELDSRKVVFSGQVWRLLTHAFCHDRYSLFHIFFNMLALFWFGCTLESMYGTREFVLFYLTAAIVAGLAFVGLDLYTGSTVPAIGASGAVMAVMMLYTMHFPTAIIRVFFLPIEMRWLMLIYVLWDLHPVLLAMAGDHVFTGVANSAHVGGAAFGFLYAKYQWRLSGATDWLRRRVRRFQRQPTLRLVYAPDFEPEPVDDMTRVDELLQKILESGQSSLTEEEREVLRSASAKLKNRSRRES